jgi:hypothetical protein
MRTEFRYTIIADFDAEDKDSTHLILSMNCSDETDFDKIDNILMNPSANTDNLFYLLPIVADDLAKLGITSSVKFKSNSWLRKQLFRFGVKYGIKQLNKLGREEFVNRYCSENYA